jgi:hypothetical protein
MATDYHLFDVLQPVSSSENPSFSAFLIINHTQWAQASIDGYVQGFPETTFLKPAPLPSEISHTSNALSPWHRS